MQQAQDCTVRSEKYLSNSASELPHVFDSRLTTSGCDFKGFAQMAYLTRAVQDLIDTEVQEAAGVRTWRLRDRASRALPPWVKARVASSGSGLSSLTPAAACWPRARAVISAATTQSAQALSSSALAVSLCPLQDFEEAFATAFY